MPPIVEVALLGPIDVRLDGAPPPPELLWRKHLATALVLLTQRPRAVPRDRLLGLLWSDRSESAARHSLNEALRVIRRACGADAVTATADAVMWSGEATLDTAMWVQTVTEDPVAAAALVRGEWCEGFVVPGASECEDWLTGERDRWRGRLVEGLVRAATVLENRGDVLAAVAVAERARAIHPRSDEASGALIRARWLAGDRAGALATGEEHRHRLAQAFGAVMAPHVAALLARVRGGETAPTNGHMPEGIPPHRALPPPLCERGELLEAAMALLRPAMASGDSTTVIWSGGAGTGRSRLLDETCARLRLEGMPIARVHAVPGDGAAQEAGLDALADAMLTALPGVGGGDPAAIAFLSGRRPAWGERFPSREGPGHYTHEAALLSILRAAADEGPLAIAVDDADRFHPEALDVLVALMRALGGRPVAFVLSVSTDVAVDVVSRLCRVVGRELPGIVLAVPPLDTSLAGALVRWAVPHWEADAHERLARRLLAEAGGSVFIAVALLEALRGGLVLPDETARWPAPDRTLEATFPGQPSEMLAVALRHAFHQLGPAQQRLVQRVALGPEPWSEPALRAAWPDEASLASSLDELEQRRWLASDDRGYRIPAAAVRRFIVEDTLTPGERRRLRAGAPDA